MARLQAMAEDQTNPPNLSEAALLAARLVQPDVEPAAYERRLDALAAELRPAVASQSQPLEIAVAMGRFLYNEKGFANSAVQSADVFVGLDQVLDKKQWNCVGMALLYVTLGERLGLPLQMVAGYGHVLVAWNGDTTFFIETTAAGGLQPRRDYLIEYLPYPCVNPEGYQILDTRGAIAMCLTQMALVMQGEERVQLAGSLFALALDFAPDYAEAHAGQGFLRAAAGNHEAAIADFERAIELDPDLREAYGGLGSSQRALGNRSGAVETYRQLVALCPDDSAAVFNTGQLLYETGDLQGAIAAFRHYIDLEPGDPEGYVRLAYPLEDSGDLPGAAEAYRQALQRAPGYADAALNLAFLLEEMRNFEASMAGYRRVLEIQPGDVRAMGGIARILGKVNRYQEALRAFRSALDQYPGAAFLWVDLGRFFENAGELRQAIGAYQEAVRAEPADPEGYYGLASALRQAGMTGQADNVLAQARSVEAAGLERGGTGNPGGDAPEAPAPPDSVEDLFPSPAAPEDGGFGAGVPPAEPPFREDGAMPDTAPSEANASTENAGKEAGPGTDDSVPENAPDTGDSAPEDASAGKPRPNASEAGAGAPERGTTDTP